MNNLNNQDPNRHIPSAAETGSVDKFAKFMRQHLIPSLEMGMVIIYNLKGEHLWKWEW